MGGLAPGDVIAERYRVDEQIGSGASGVVYRGRHLALDHDVAIKVLRDRLAPRPGARARFEREALVAASLRHPNAVQVMDFGEHASQLYMVMELLEGAPLRTLVARGAPPVPLPRALRIARQIADVLIAAHAIQLVHRDLKPENVLLEAVGSTRERARVVDFGLAFIADTGPDDDPAAEAPRLGRMTRDGVVGGTPNYLSPEQALGRPIGPAADIYSLGCVLYELGCGQVPFSGQLTELLSRHAYAAPVPPSERAPERGLPVALDELIVSMLSKSPAERPTAKRVRDRIDALSGDDDTDTRTRGRDSVERSARMVAPAPVPALSADPPEAITIAIDGACARELTTGLSANNIRIIDLEAAAPGAKVSAVYAPGATDARLRELATRGVPVVGEIEAGDMTRLARSLRAGVADMVTLPVQIDELARKLRRAARKHR